MLPSPSTRCAWVGGCARVQEYLTLPDPYKRQFLLSWLGLLDSLPEVSLVPHLPCLLPGLLGLLSDTNPEIRQGATKLLQASRPATALPPVARPLLGPPCHPAARTHLQSWVRQRRACMCSLPYKHQCVKSSIASLQATWQHQTRSLPRIPYLHSCLTASRSFSLWSTQALLQRWTSPPWQKSLPHSFFHTQQQQRRRQHQQQAPAAPSPLLTWRCS